MLSKELIEFIYRVQDSKKKANRIKKGLPEEDVENENVNPSMYNSKRNSVAPTLIPKIHSGFAFSQEPGHDVEVLRKLPTFD